MKKRTQLNYYIEVYKIHDNDDYELFGYLQKDGNIGYESIYSTNKAGAEFLVKTIDAKEGLCAVCKDIRFEEDDKIKKQLLFLMK